MKPRGEKIAMLTAYDYPTAKALDQAGVDIVLVGDSLANVVLGLESTKDVGIEEMIHHTKAARRGVNDALLVGDMPYESYQKNPQNALKDAKRFIEQAGCDAVKIEWFDGALDVARDLVSNGIALMGHVGLTPQTADLLGGLKVQGRQVDSARRIIEQAKAFEQAGCFAVVLECIPAQIAEIITRTLTIPTIGIGAGVDCDGQVLVTHDLLGLFDDYKPKFVRQYAQLSQDIQGAVGHFCTDVKNKQFPANDESFRMNADEFNQIQSPNKGL